MRTVPVGVTLLTDRQSLVDGLTDTRDSVATKARLPLKVMDRSILIRTNRLHKLRGGCGPLDSGQGIIGLGDEISRKVVVKNSCRFCVSLLSRSRACGARYLELSVRVNAQTNDTHTIVVVVFTCYSAAEGWRRSPRQCIRSW